MKKFTPEEARLIGSGIGVEWERAAFLPKTLAEGMNVELEHGSDPRTNVVDSDPYKIAKIAWQHLMENPRYYEQLQKMEAPLMIQHQGAVYRRASNYDDAYLKGQGVLFYVFALLTSKTGKNLPGVDAGFTKLRASIPPELKADMTAEQKVAATEAAKAGLLWYVKIAGKGWQWGARNGAKHVPDIQECLEFLGRFQNNDTLDGVSCLYCEVYNNILGR